MVRYTALEESVEVKTAHEMEKPGPQFQGRIRPAAARLAGAPALTVVQDHAE